MLQKPITGPSRWLSTSAFIDSEEVCHTTNSREQSNEPRSSRASNFKVIPIPSDCVIRNVRSQNARRCLMNPSQVSRAHRIGYIRLSLKSCFVLLAASALLCVFYGHWQIRRPIPWRVYQPSTLSSKISSQSPLFILIGADWDMNSKLVRDVALERSALKQLLKNRSVRAYYADYTLPSPLVDSLLMSIGKHSTPHLLVYPNGPTGKPIVLSGWVETDNVIAAIETPPPKLNSAASSHKNHR